MGFYENLDGASQFYYSATVMMETFELADMIRKMHSEPLPQAQVPNMEFVK